MKDYEVKIQDIMQCVPRNDVHRLITDPSLSHEVIHSQYGRCRMEDWCEMDAERIRAAGGKAEAIHRTGINGLNVSYIVKP